METKKKLWTDVMNGKEDYEIRAFVPLPKGLIGSKCPKCGSSDLRGAVISQTADEDDPDILCMGCGYWRA